MRSIPIDVLRAFVAVVDARGFTRAGEELGRSQPTISLQVKRLEELVEAPLFEKATRFALTPVGAACFDYGKRLLRLHDDMLDEAARRRAPGAALRIGVPSAFASRLGERIPVLRKASQAGRFELIAEASERLADAFRHSALDLAIVESDEEDAAARWRAPLAWFGSSGGAKNQPLPILLPPSEDAVHRSAVAALRSQGRAFEIV